jgi:hypothetical protein
VDRRRSRILDVVRGLDRAAVVGVLALVCLVVSLPGRAQSRLDRAVQVLEQQSRSGRGEFINFLIGAASAYRWAETGGAGATYCPPPEMKLDGRVYAKMTLEEYKRGKGEYAKIGGYPLDVLTLALLRSLRARFPCADDEAPEES